MNILWVNLHKYPLNMPVVRQAISMTINRTAMANISWSGYSPAVTNLTGVTPGMASTWSTPALAKKYKVVYDPTAAKKMLLKAGFKMGDNGTLLTPKGTTLNISIDVPTPFSDDVAASQLISQELKQIGINVKLQDNSRNAYYSKLQLGQFDIAVSWSPWGANPFFTLYPSMSQTYSAPYGKYAIENFGRYNNPKAQTLGQRFLRTYSQSQQVPIVLKLQQIFCVAVADHSAHVSQEVAFGVSFTYFPAPVSQVIGGMLPWTLFLIGLSTIIAFILAIFSTCIRRGGAVQDWLTRCRSRLRSCLRCLIFGLDWRFCTCWALCSAGFRSRTRTVKTSS